MPSRIDAIEMIDDTMAEILRRKTDSERLMMIDQMWRFARDMIRNNLRREHPDWTEDAIQQATARRLSHGAV